MKRGCLISLVVVGIVFLLIISIAGFIIGGINRVVGLDEDVKASWAQVENQLKRRADLIPNLVNTVKGYATHEKEIFENIAAARARLSGAIKGNKSISEKIAASQQLEGFLSRLLMIVERYPDLKANQTFLRLMDELSGTENRIAVERMRYNRSVRSFNTYIRRIPGSFFAALKGLSKAPYFEVEEKDKAVPKVAF